MAIFTNHFYAFPTNTFVFGGIDITQFMPDGGAEYELPSEMGEVQELNDGASVLVASPANAAIVTLSLSETSNVLPRFMALAQAQRTAINLRQRPLGYTWLHVCGSTGDTVRDSGCMFLSHGVPTKARGLSARDFRILLPNGAANISLGALNR